MKHSTAVLILVAAWGCSEEKPPENGAFFPTDYLASYEEVRDCRVSIEHSLARIIVYADPDASERYTGGQYPFAPGSVIVKEEFVNDDCTDRTGFTVMRKAAAGEHENTLGWEWQTLDRNMKPIETDSARCVACHEPCSDRDFTCTEP